MLPLYNYDNPQAPAPTGSKGSKLPLYDYGPIPPPKAPLPKKPGFLSQARAAAGKVIGAIGKVAMMPSNALSETQFIKDVARNPETSLGENVLKTTASLVGGSSPENLPLGVGEVIKQGKEYIKTPVSEFAPNVTFGDWLTGMKTGGVEFAKLPVSGALEAPSIATAGKYQPEIKFDIPGIGEISNSDYKIAQRVTAGEDPNLVVAQEKFGGFLNALFLVGLASRPFISRPTIIGSQKYSGGVPAGRGVITAPPLKSFRPYKAPQYTQPLTPEFVQKIAQEKNITLSPKYDPSLPTFFKMTGSGNKITTEVVQIKPSYVKTFINMLRGDVSKVPSGQVTQLLEIKTDTKAIEQAKSQVPVIPRVPVPKIPIAERYGTQPLVPPRKAGEVAPTIETPPPTPAKPVITPVPPNVNVLSTPETPIVNPPQEPISIDIQNMVPKEVRDKAEMDWEENYADEALSRSDQIMKLQQEIKTAKAAERAALKKQLETLFEEDAKIEDEFVTKWRSQATPVHTYEKNDVIKITEKATGRSQERIVTNVHPDGLMVMPINGVGIPNKASFSKWDVSFIKKGEAPRMGPTFKELDDMEKAGVKTEAEAREWREAQTSSQVVYRGGGLREAGGGEQDFGQGFYFADKLSTAEGHGKPQAYSISLKNPLKIKDRYEMNGIWDEFLATKSADNITLRDWLKSKGYDGIVIKDGGMGGEKGVGGFKVAFDKSQITEVPISTKTLTIKPEDLKGKEKVRVMGPGNLKEVPLEIKGTRVPRPAQLITKTDLKAAIKTYPGEKAEFTVREVDGQKRLELEAEGRKVSMRPSALGLVEDNIAVGDKVTITAEDLKAPGTALRGVNEQGETVASLIPREKKELTLEIPRAGGNGIDRYFQTSRPGVYVHEFVDKKGRSIFVPGRVKDGVNFAPYRNTVIAGMNIKETQSFSSFEEALAVAENPRTKFEKSGTNTELFKEIEYSLEKGEAPSLASDLKEGVVEPAKSVEELKHKIDQLNKFAQSQAILRRTGGLSTKYGGVFRSIPKDKLATHPNLKNIPKRGIVHLQDSVVGSPRNYMSTLAHELGHALDYTVNGSTSNTIRIFGKDLPDDVKKTIIAELKANTEVMVGKAVAQKGAGYYYKPTELFARFLENMFAKPGQVEELSPIALKYLEKSAIETPIISEYLEAVYGRIDKGERKHIFLRDMKQTYQKHLGTRVGEMAWNDEMRYRAMKERAMIQVEKLVKAKFKGVKDDPETLFRAAESIKVTKNDAPVYGTRDFKSTRNDKEAQELYDLGWEPLLDSEGNHVYELSDGEQMMRFAKPRYTPEEAKRLFESLSPEGQQLIKDFTAAKDEAKDYFNREMIKDVHKINTDLEGWVHRYWEEKGGGIGGRQLRTKTAAAKKQRKGAEGYVEDLQKAMTKALTELETAKAYNAFIEDYFARVSKPIEKGAEPDDGWVEVQGDVKKGGVALPGEVRKIVIEDGKATPAGAVRYQMPAEIYKRFQIIRKVAVEASKTAQIMNNLNRYWRVNILFHPGSASTNFISGGIQYSAKVLTDFYVEVLTGSIKFQKTRRNIFSMLTAVTPKGWQDAPDWIYGGDLSNFYGQFLTSSTPGIKVLDKSVDVYADKTLKVYGAVERYWKKVVTLSEGGSKLGGLNQMTKEGLRLPTEEEKDLLDQINKEIDLFAYDYENVPTWLEDYQQSGIAQAIKPFAKYPYKYAKQLTEMIGAAFDGTLPWQERVAKLLTIFTIIAAYAVVREQRKKKQKTAEVDINAPASVSTAGRLFIGTDAEGNEMFTRTAKYPFLNLSEAGAQLLEGNTNTGLQVLQDMLGGVAPVGHLGLAAVGYRSEYETYIPFPALVGKDLASFVPGTRVLQDITKFYDPYQRKPATFFQGIGSLWPTTDEALQEKLHGERKMIQVPLEGAVFPRPGEGTKRTTTDMLVQNYKNDILLGLLFGLYVKRIDPDVAAAFVTRSEENAKKKEIDDARAALKKSLTK